MRKLGAATLAGIAAVAIGCGGSSETVDTVAQQRAAARRAAAVRAERLRARQEADYATCKRVFGRLQRSIGALNSRLSVGLTYADYGRQVADVMVVYDQIDTSAAPSVDCIDGVGIPLEGALNQHIRAQSTWSDCFDDYDCDQDSITPDLQSRWARASRAVEKSRTNLEKIAPR